MSRSPVLDTPGAVPAPEGSPDAAVPWHFGDPFAEQRAAARTVAVVDRSHRELIAVPGDDRLSWLHLVVSQHVTGLAEGSGTEALVLDSQGRVDAHLLLAHVDGVVWLDTEAGAETAGARPGRVPLLTYFEQMVFWSKVEPRDATAERAVLSLVGPRTPELLAELGLPVPAGPYAVAAGSDVIVRRMPWPGHDAADLLVPRGALLDWWRRITDAGARPMGSLAFEALRVESRRPRLGLDTDERAIPHEVGWVHVAAHVAKGCYRGQETVSKVENVGRPPRRLLLLHLDGSDTTPEPGDEVRAGERVVGKVGSVVQHHELGPIALALLKRSVEPGTPLVVGESTGASIDPDSIPAETPALGRAAAQGLRG
ncbi:CAF17-like 4Fe-4S cluster assembly/insertion protein YgfZ [Actinokineospora bangkokensis]|uniref:Folate-binding protein YgfZ n=1 Tax=Actinokineospora bangkokensis TaxID=1193682 RepID=A0A1Q9LFQ0_9PSEU|nr:folate-binding protein YgfZ [Actinokineospora bangkokensis]OLR90853.1 folate-binding protein YgfZ [Actinokineospora bangkokensis]